MNWTLAQQQALLKAIQRRNERVIIGKQLAQTKAELIAHQQEQASLQQQWQDEQADVDRLQRLSWASVWYEFLNQKEQQISKEEAEAQQARVRYDAMNASIDNLQKQQVQQESRLVDYKTANAEYEQLIGEKRVALSYAFEEKGRKYQDYVTELTDENHYIQELDEAHKAGMNALDEVSYLVKLLDQARRLGTWDMIGGSAFSSAMKYQKLDDVRDQSYRVTRQLAVFRAEYADLEQAFLADWQFDDNLTRFVDIFFDNIFTDWSVQNRIHSALETALALENQLVQAIAQLKIQIEQSVERTKQKADALQRFLEVA